MSLHIADQQVLDALKAAARADLEKGTSWSDFVLGYHKHGRDEVSVGVGPLGIQVAAALGLPQTCVRRRLLWLESKGLAMRQPPKARGTAHRWWPVGLAAEIKAEIDRGQQP